MSLLDQLGLTGAADAERLAAGAKTFQPVHVGNHDLPMGELLDLVVEDDTLLPPRTGHLGNWDDITAGRAGPMDFNTAICGAGYGYPLIYGFTRTEADTVGGDEAYKPGSVIERGQRERLSLHTWDGRSFTRRDRSQPLFCPLVQAEVDGTLVPLVDVHWQRMQATAAYPFRHWAVALDEHAQLVTDMLTLLIEQAATQGRNQAYAELVSQAVRLDGEVGRCDLVPDGSGFLLDGHRYASARDVAEATLLLVRSLVEPRWFFEQMTELPPVLPVLSLQMTNVLFGLLGMHRPVGAAGLEKPFTVHLHWGARAMAGCPPRRGGYLARRSTVRSLRAITDPLVAHFAEADPLCFVLLPAQVFMLCPRSTTPRDVAAMTELFRTVQAAAPGTAYDVTVAWLGEHQERLSPYLSGRFRPWAGVPADGADREPATPVEPPGFRELTFRQACGIVAAFEEVLG